MCAPVRLQFAAAYAKIWQKEVNTLAYNSYEFKRNLLLNLIAHAGPVSRTELGEMTDYRPASVTDITRELLDEKLIVETDHISDGPGRKRVLLEINKQHICAVGIAFTADAVSYVVSAIDGSVLAQSNHKMPKSQDREELIQMIGEQVSVLFRQFPKRKIVGIGISEPLFDPSAYQKDKSLLANYTHFNDWIHLSLKPQLEKQFGVQVGSYSGVTLPAMAEQRFGAAKGAQNFICVELSNGLGTSICCNGVPVAGARGMAGELGHTVIEYGNANQKLCYCGKPGCVEVSTAYPALANAISQALQSGVFSSLSKDKPITVEAIREAVEQGDRMCRHHVKEAATRIGVSIANAVNLLNPELVVLYGFMLDLGDYFLQKLEQSLRENVLSIASDFELRVSASMDALLPLGAVAEIFSEYLHSDDYKWVYRQ